MKLTKLVAAPELRDKVPPRARAVSRDAGTVSQLIPGVRRTRRERGVRELREMLPPAVAR
jgi:hypothetical protein